MVNAGIFIEANGLNLVVLDAEGQGTAITTVATDRIDLFKLPGARLEFKGARQNRADRAHGHTLSTELAIQAAIKGGCYLGFKSPIDKRVRPKTNHLVTNPHTFAAQNTAVHVALNQGIDLIGRQIKLFPLKAIGNNFVFVGQILQVAFATLVAHRTINNMIDKEKLKYGFTYFANLIRHGVNDHPFGHRCRTGRNQASLHLLDFHQTDAARAIWQQLLGITEHRYVNTVLLGRLVDSRCFGGCDLFSVNR